MERAVIVYNPAARNAPPWARLQAAARALKADGWEVDLRATDAAGHGAALAREAVAAGAAAVLACGGDGTINEVVNGLAGSSVSLGVIRGGMGDVFAKEAGVPREPEQALRLLVDGWRRRIDLGLAGERYFLIMAGIGFDARIVERVPSAAKRRLGSTAYALWGIAELRRYEVRHTRLSLDGVEQEADLFWLLLGNTRSYGGVLNITNKAYADDGRLDGYIFAGRGLAWALGTGARLALRRQDGATGVTFQRIESCEIMTGGLPVQVDGEHIGETPMRFAVAPAALSVILPPRRHAFLQV